MTDTVTILGVAEGYATAATAHEATGFPVAVAFDAGNLLPVAKALRGKYPQARIVVFGDDDAGTAQATGKNPGREKATAAARAVDGVAVLPAGLPPGGTDWNDLAGHVGLDAVREQIEAALKADPPRPRAARRRQPDASPDRFYVDDEALWYRALDDDGQERPPIKVSTPIRMLARTHNDTSTAWGCLFELLDPAGKWRTLAVPASLLVVSNGNELLARLSDAGLILSGSARAKPLLLSYLQSRTVDEFALSVDRVGWVRGSAFVTPGAVYQPPGATERIVLQAETMIEDRMRVRGTVKSWIDSVATLCRGNSRLIFMAALAFSGTLLRPARVGGGGFHFKGSSSCGKSTALYIGASVWGARDYVGSWRGTDNGHESVGVANNDGTAFFDEMGQIDPQRVGETAYLLANGIIKTRQSRSGSLRARPVFLLNYGSTGEVDIAQHAAAAGKGTNAGMELRLVTIPAEVQPGTVFESVHGHDGGSAFSDALVAAADRHHGAVGVEWIKWCVAHASELPTMLTTRLDACVDAWVPESAVGQVHRVARRFAVVAAAAELATEAGLTGWSKGDAERAVRTCFNAWLSDRPGGTGLAEDAAIERQVRLWFANNHEGRFQWAHRTVDDRAPAKGLTAGYRRLISPGGKPIESNSDHVQEYGLDKNMSAKDADESALEFLLFKPVFAAEVVKEFDVRRALQVLRDRGLLLPNPGRPFDYRARIPGLGSPWVYRFSSAILDGND